MELTHGYPKMPMQVIKCIGLVPDPIARYCTTIGDMQGPQEYIRRGRLCLGPPLKMVRRTLALETLDYPSACLLRALYGIAVDAKTPQMLLVGGLTVVFMLKPAHW